MLLYTYIKRVKIPLAIASSVCAILFLCMSVLPVSTMMMVFFISVHTITHALFSRLFLAIAPRISHQTRRNTALFLSMLIVAVGFWFPIPHLFLFFNALSSSMMIPIICIPAFMIAFEKTLFIRGLHLGNNYSLLNLLRHPHTGLEQLRRTLSRPSHAEQLRAQARAELNGRNTGRTPESLRLPNADYQQLLQRETRALEQLPLAAHIDDENLYQQHLNDVITEGKILKDRIAANAKQSTPTNPMELEAEIRVLIHMEALERTSDAADELEEAYCETLSSSLQKAQYMEYRKLKRLLSPPYAECETSAESILDYPSKHFVIVEKRFVKNNKKCIAGNVHFWAYQRTFLDIFTKRTPKNPANNDPLYAPRDEEGQPAVYTFHTYHTVKGHAVSFHLCEAIEAVLAAGLKAVPANNNTVITSVQLPPGAHRATPPLQQARLSEQNAFSSVPKDSVTPVTPSSILSMR